MVHRFYRTSVLFDTHRLLQRLRAIIPDLTGIDMELCYYIDTPGLVDREEIKLRCLLSQKFEQERLTKEPQLTGALEFGTRLSRVTPDSTNAISICRAGGLKQITRLEISRRYLLRGLPNNLSTHQRKRLHESLHDRMTESVYPESLLSFETSNTPEPVFCSPILERGPKAIQEFADQMGLAFNPELVSYLENLCHDMGRNLTNVEIYNFGQLNSDHARHNTFALTKWRQGAVVLPYTLMDLIRQTNQRHPGRTLSAFKDNAAAIRGFDVLAFQPSVPGKPSAYEIRLVRIHITYKMETHNHPSGVEPYEGGGTGLMGLLRDSKSLGLGGEPVGCVSQYAVSTVCLTDWRPWLTYRASSSRLQSAKHILIGASNGVSDSGNQIGLPLITGTAREFRLNLPGEEFGFDKPWVAVGAIGEVREGHVFKAKQQVNDLIVQLGGDAYPIGLGGSSASSKATGSQSAELDFDSVQRTNAEMQQRGWRVIRTCIQLGSDNPIIDIQDLGAGGDCCAVPELIRHLGGKVKLRQIPCGDVSMSVMVYWCNESQERFAVVCRPSGLNTLKQIAKRERCPLAVIGIVDGSGRFVLEDESAPKNIREQRYPVDLSFKSLLGDLPIQIRDLKKVESRLSPLKISPRLTFAEAVQRMLSLVSVGSKAYLVNKIDRSVGGRVAQQPTVGPLQLPLADVGVVASGFEGLTGSAVALGEKPVSWIVSPEASVRMSVAESLLNLASVTVTDFEDISLSGNWGVPAAAAGEYLRLYRAVEAVNHFLDKLGISINVGKDSTSMHAEFTAGGRKHKVKSPGVFTVSAYAPVFDITKKSTPDIKRSGDSKLMVIDLSGGKRRLGASALGYVCGQVGNKVPDIDDPKRLVSGFRAIQKLVDRGLALSYHDACSDGGLIVAVLEMALAGNCGLDLNFRTVRNNPQTLWGELFAEEARVIIEYLPQNIGAIKGILQQAGLTGCYHTVGRTLNETVVYVKHNHCLVWQETTPVVREWWHEISYRLDCEQANPNTSNQEKLVVKQGRGLKFNLSFTPRSTPKRWLVTARPQVVVLREEGTNGDVELAQIAEAAGFSAVDVSMSDLACGQIKLDYFAGLLLAGGFSFKDVFGAGRGWAYVIKNNPVIHHQFQKFTNRKNTFILGICNGFQVMTELGLLPGKLLKKEQPSLVINRSGRFESRMVMVKVIPSPSIFLQGMTGSIIGIWVAHKEGRLYYRNQQTLQYIKDNQLAPLCFVDDNGELTEEYPFNPNGSSFGITALTSSDGRFMGMMPHPERLFLKWQWPYWPPEWKKLQAPPWLKMFQNAREWCKKNK